MRVQDDPYIDQVKYIDITHKGGHAFGFIARSSDYIMLCDDENGAAGQMALNLSERYQMTKVAILDKLFVPPEFRWKGIGTALVSKFVEIAKKHKAQALLVCACPPDANDFDRLIKFYQKFGFKCPNAMREAELELILQKKPKTQKESHG